MNESEFLQDGANALLVNIETLRVVLESVGFDKKLYNARNIATLKKEFNRFLFENTLSSFEVGIVKIASATHPTSFIKKDSEKCEYYVESSSLGKINGNDEENKQIPKTYFFKELFYDSQIERENILQDIEGVEVFTKIPKNTLKIPVAGGKSYTPDFAYILKSGDKGQIYCVIESKGKDERDLSKEERLKIARAEKFLEQSGIFNVNGAKIYFKSQLEGDTIIEILRDFLESSK